jgi:hypothetical protein
MKALMKDMAYLFPDLLEYKLFPTLQAKGIIDSPFHSFSFFLPFVCDVPVRYHDRHGHADPEKILQQRDGTQKDQKPKRRTMINAEEKAHWIEPKMRVQLTMSLCTSRRPPVFRRQVHH